jgi:hypothetical protein
MLYQAKMYAFEVFISYNTLITDICQEKNRVLNPRRGLAAFRKVYANSLREKAGARERFCTQSRKARPAAGDGRERLKNKTCKLKRYAK